VLATGRKLGPYEILAALGAGGMGEVYRARDTKLNRDVALKVLPEVFARDAERMARFRREAQVLASLNHPNIATIHGLEESNGHCALVMELVEGPTLAERIRVAQGPLSGPAAFRVEEPQCRKAGVALQIDETLHIAKQIAEGLEYAHERGVIHRDLKPANVKVRPDGTVKILDFGLAKALEETPAADSINNSPTISAAATREGVILGTAAYMSPEQARGKTVDRRCDIWSFGALTIAVIGLALLVVVRKLPRAERMQFVMPVQSEVTHLALSADGGMLAYVARDDVSGENMLYIQRIGSVHASMLPGTEGAYYPFWSPDGAYVGFFSNGELKKVAVAGGPPEVIAEATSGRGGARGKRGLIIYAPDAGGPLWRVNADGTNPAPLTAKLYATTENSHRWPVFLSDGDRFLFYAGTFASATENRTDGIYLSSLAALEKKLLVPARSNAGYSHGQLLYVDDKRELITVPVDAPHAKLTGESRVLAVGVAYQPSVLWGAFSVGGNGTVVYNTSTAAALSVLAWYDRTGKELARVGGPGVLANPSISPDGSRAAVDIADLKVNNVDIWIDDLKHETTSRFTFDPPEEASGVWSRDGRMLAYRLNAVGGVALETKRARGLEPNRTVFTTPSHDDLIPNSWTPDDKQILCTLHPAAGGSDLVLIDVSSGKNVPFLARKASQTNGQISPDGKWVAYASNETGDWEVYVTTFPNPVGKWQVSRGGGTEPRWRGDGGEIFYISLKGALTAAEVSTEATFSTGATSLLFQLRGRAPISSTDLFTYDVTRDGKRFLVNRYVKPDHVQSLTVVLNAAAEMK
jgi:Tol biopolymer transport system component